LEGHWWFLGGPDPFLGRTMRLGGVMEGFLRREIHPFSNP